MINPLLTKIVPSRWLDIRLIRFCEFIDLGSVLVHKYMEKEIGQYPAILTSCLVNNPYILLVPKDKEKGETDVGPATTLCNTS